MQKRACVYGELDSYTGYIRQDDKDLPKLLRDLKFCCLFYDDVIVNTGVVLSHSLTLPAFEMMSPFVKAGRLWTTGRDTENSPTQFINDRIDRFYGGDSSNKTAKSITSVIDRWQAVAPERWRLVRKLSVQVGSATENIFNNLSALDFSGQEAYQKEHILEHVQSMHSEGIFDRDLTLAKIASMNGILSASNTATMSLLVQAELMNQATRNKGHDSIVLFPGIFLRKVNHNRGLFQQEPLPVDYATVKRAITRFATLGYSLSALLSLPINTLFQLAISRGWSQFRAILLSEQWRKSHSQEMYSMYLRKLNFYTAASSMVQQNKALLFEKTPITTSDAWQLYSLANLGNYSQKEHRAQDAYVLELSSRRLYLSCEPEKTCIVSYKQMLFLSVLIGAGRFGVNTAQLKQLDIEETLVKHQKYKWHAHFTEQDCLDESRMDRISVAKVRLNQLLADLNVMVDNRNGRWTIRAKSGHDFELKDNYWQTSDSKGFSLPVNITLPPMLKILFACLFERSPYYVNLKLLSKLLYNCEEKQTRKVSDAIYKLKKKLLSTPYKIIKSCTGEYALVSQRDPHDESN